VARNLKGVVHFQPPEIVVRDIDGSLAGGRLNGELGFRRDSEKFTGQGHIELVGANARSLLAANNNAVDGLVTIDLRGETIGLSPDAVVGGLHGGGTIALTNGRFGGLDPAVFDAAIHAADQQSGAMETTKQLGLLVGAAMDKGRLAVPQGNAEVTINAGQIRLARATLQAQSGADLSLEGALDLNTASIDARMVLSAQPPPNALLATRPELTVTLKGPLAAPERRVDVAALLGWLTLRTTEQQTRRIESLEANRRADVAGPALRPVPPSTRIIPQGTALEITSKSSGTAVSMFDSHEFDRLRPAAPAAVPAGRSDRGAALPPAPPPVKPAAPRPAPGVGGTTATAAPAASAPQPAVHSPLDLLFHSQN
jgi:AsmA-like C-terminal region